MFMQDFGDGIGGTVYRQKLEVFVRYLKKKAPQCLYDVAGTHDISDILTQIQSESTRTEDSSTHSKDQERPEVTELLDDGSKGDPVVTQRLQERIAAVVGQQEFQNRFRSIRNTLKIKYNSIFKP